MNLPKFVVTITLPAYHEADMDLFQCRMQEHGFEKVWPDNGSLSVSFKYDDGILDQAADVEAAIRSLMDACHLQGRMNAQKLRDAGRAKQFCDERASETEGVVQGLRN